MIPISDIRGGSTEYPAVGHLTFRIGDQEQQLTAFGFPGSGEFSPLFKDADERVHDIWIPQSAYTDGEERRVDGHRLQRGGQSSVCLFDSITTCPLPPAENRLAVAIEAGEKRFPTGRGFVQQ